MRHRCAQLAVLNVVTLGLLGGLVAAARWADIRLFFGALVIAALLILLFPIRPHF